MKPILVAAVAALLGFSCHSSPTASSHWNASSWNHRMARHLLGYDRSRGSIFEHQVQATQEVGLTVRRHFLNDNPENPFQYGGYAGGPYDMSKMWIDTWVLGRDLAINAGRTFVFLVLAPADLATGFFLSNFGIPFHGYATLFEEEATAPDPSTFRVRNP